MKLKVKKLVKPRKSFNVISQTVFFNVTPHQVYDAFLDVKKHSEFTGYKATGIPSKVNGKFITNDGYSFGRTLKLKKDKLIVQEWKTTEWPEDYPYSTLKIVLIKSDGGTKLVFTQTKVPSSQSKNYSEGWKKYYWLKLKKYLKA